MADPIVIQLVAKGVAEMQATFRTLEQTITGFERNASRASESGSRARITTTQREGSDRDKAYAKLSRETEKWERQAVAATERAAKEKTKAGERSAADQVRAVEKAEQDKQKAVEKSAAFMARIRERSATMAGQYAAQQAEKEIAESKRAYEARKNFARNMGGMITGSVSGAMHSVVGAGRGLVAGALQVGGGFSIADSVSREMKLTGIAGNIAASGNADPSGKKWKTGEILKAARGNANALSMDPEEMLGGIEAFKKLTGDTGRGIALSSEMGKLSVATGTNMKDMMSNAGNIALSDPNMSNKDVMNLAMVQTKQGMTGAVEMSDLAKYGGRLTAGASLFGGDRSKNIAMMGAFAQLSRAEGGAASAAEASLAAQRFATDVQKHSGGLKKLGIDVSDGKGGLRAADDIVKDMVNKTGGDVTKFGQFHLGERGVKVLTAVSNEYRAASGGTRQKGESDASWAGRQAKGEKAVNAALGKFTEGLSQNEVDASLKERLGDADKEVAKAMNELRDAVGIQLLPEFMKLVPVLTQLMPHIQRVLVELTKFANWFAANPIKGIGAVVLAKVTADLGKAAIGEGVKQVLIRLLAGAAPGGGGVPGAGGVPGGAAGVGVAGAMVAQGAALHKIGTETLDASQSGKAEGKEIAAMLASSDPKARAEGQRRYGEAKKKTGALASTATGAERGASVLGILVNPVAAAVHYGTEEGLSAAGLKKKDSAQSLEQIKATEIVNTVELRKQIATAVVGGVADGMASKAGTPASANAPSTTLPLSARP